jgi:hypothetical protein
MGHRLAKPRHLGTGGNLVDVAQRELVKHRGEPPQGAGDRDRTEPPLLLGHDYQPRRRRLQRQAAARGGLAVKLGGADLDREPGEIVARIRRHRPLNEPQIARTDHPDPIRMPRLSADPAQRRQSVGSFVERVEIPLGAECSPHALDHHLKTTFGEQPAEQQPGELAPAVRRAHQYGGLGTLVAGNCHPPIGEQNRAVVHLDRQVALVGHVVSLRSGEAHLPGESHAGKTHDSRVSETKASEPGRRQAGQPGRLASQVGLIGVPAVEG